MDSQHAKVYEEELRRENARLIALLDANGIEWRKSAPPEAKSEAPHGQRRLSTEQKISLFKRLFRERQFVRSRASNVPTAAIGNSFRFLTKCSMTT